MGIGRGIFISQRSGVFALLALGRAGALPCPSARSASGPNPSTPRLTHQSAISMQASARLASSAASKRLTAGVRSTITRSCYGASRGKAHAAPLSAQEPPPKGQKKISKQERRVKIEEYVEKYRASNGGKFPTISHVRQLLGGTHYTVREIIQELEYNHANPPVGNVKEAQGTTKHSRSTYESKAAQFQGAVPYPENSCSKDDNGKNPNNLKACKSDEKDDVPLSLNDATTGTATIEKIETSMSSDHTVETEAAIPDFHISYSMKNADDTTLSDQTEYDSMKDITNNPAISLGVDAKSDPGKQEGETEVKKLDMNNTVNYLNPSEPTVSDQSGSDKSIKRIMPDSEHDHNKNEVKESTETGLLGSLKSFAYGIRNFWKNF